MEWPMCRPQLSCLQNFETRRCTDFVTLILARYAGHERGTSAAPNGVPSSFEAPLHRTTLPCHHTEAPCQPCGACACMTTIAIGGHRRSTVCVCVVSFIHPRAGRTHATTKLHEGTGFYSQTG